MKRCPTCQQTYDDTQTLCFADGTPLVMDMPAYDPAKTAVASTPPPPASDIPPTQVIGTNTPPNYQPYQPQQQQQQQWTPPQQQQWGAPPARNMNKLIILVAAGLVVAVGIGLLVYFLTRSSSSDSTSSSGGASTAASRFVGTWVEENRPNARGTRFTEDGKVIDTQPGGREETVGTYSVTGDKATITLTRGTTQRTVNATLESNSRMRLEADGRTIYVVKK